MKTITGSQINRNKGEAFVSYLLSQHCLVRHVPNGTDVGIDLYCETINELHQAHNHFWVQVKASQNGKFKSVREKDIQYWRRQPTPVFVFCVQLNKCAGSDTFQIKVANLVEEFVKAGPSRSPSASGLKYDTLRTPADIELFVNAVVPEAVSRRQFMDGVILPMKPVEEHYLKEYPSVENFHKFEKQALPRLEGQLVS